MKKQKIFKRTYRIDDKRRLTLVFTQEPISGGFSVHATNKWARGIMTCGRDAFGAGWMAREAAALILEECFESNEAKKIVTRKPGYPGTVTLEFCTECDSVIEGGLCEYTCKYDGTYRDATIKKNRRPKSKIKKIVFVRK